MTNVSRRTALKAGGVGLASALGVSPFVYAQDKYPSKPITLVVPQPAGGDADAFCRSLQAKMQEVLGQPVVIDNKGGAGGNIGTAFGAKAQPDGYTLVFVNQGTMALNPHLYPNPGYTVAQFDPVAHLATINLLICVHPSVPAKTLQEFLELAKKEPGKYAYGSAGNGSANHLAGEMLKSMAKVDLMHVPYRGGAPAITAALGGETACVIAFPMAALPHVKAGKLRALAVTGTSRAKALPDIPTVAECGVKGYEFASWFGFVVPKGTPAPIVARLQQAAQAALKVPEVNGRLIANLTQPETGGPKEFGQLIASENARWSGLIKQYGLKID